MRFNGFAAAVEMGHGGDAAVQPAEVEALHQVVDQAVAQVDQFLQLGLGRVIALGVHHPAMAEAEPNRHAHWLPPGPNEHSV